MEVFLVIVVLSLFIFSGSVFAEDWNQKLLESAKNGDLESVKSAIEKAADVNVKDKWDETPLHYAADKGHLEIAKFLIEKGADVNAKDEWGWTPLHLASTAEILKLLIEKGADVNAKSKGGWTALKIAIEEGKTNVTNYLKSVGGKE